MNKNNQSNKYEGIFSFPWHWDFQTKLLLKQRFAQLRLSDLKLELGKENELMDRIGVRLDKNRFQVIELLKNLKFGQ